MMIKVTDLLLNKSCTGTAEMLAGKNKTESEFIEYLERMKQKGTLNYEILSN